MSACYLRVRCSLWCLSCSSSFTENMDEPSMYICRMKAHKARGFSRFHPDSVDFYVSLLGNVKTVEWRDSWAGGLPCPARGPSHRRRKAWPESAEWSESPERTLCCSGRSGCWCPEDERERWDRFVSSRRQERRANEWQRCTSMISVWACLVQKAWGGVVQLTATKLVGLRSREGVTSSLQAVVTYKHRRRLQTVGLNSGMVTNPRPGEGCFNTVFLSCCKQGSCLQSCSQVEQAFLTSPLKDPSIHHPLPFKATANYFWPTVGRWTSCRHNIDVLALYKLWNC